MARDLADNTTLGGAVALLTSGIRATSGSRLHKSSNKLSGVTTMAYEEFDEYVYICIQMHIYYVVSLHEIIEHGQDVNSR